MAFLTFSSNSGKFGIWNIMMQNSICQWLSRFQWQIWNLNEHQHSEQYKRRNDLNNHLKKCIRIQNLNSAYWSELDYPILLPTLAVSAGSSSSHWISSSSASGSMSNLSCGFLCGWYVQPLWALKTIGHCQGWWQIIWLWNMEVVLSRTSGYAQLIDFKMWF